MLEQNLKLAQQINDEARKQADSPYVGKIIGLANGQVVVITDDWNDLARRLRQIEPETSRTMGFKAGVDYSQIQEIWESN